MCLTITPLPPNVELYAAVPASKRPLDKTISESESNPDPLCCKNKLLGLVLPIIGVTISE